MLFAYYIHSSYERAHVYFVIGFSHFILTVRHIFVLDLLLLYNHMNFVPFICNQLAFI